MTPAHLTHHHAQFLAQGYDNTAAALATLYFLTTGRPMPSPEVVAVRTFLNSRPPFEQTNHPASDAGAASEEDN